MTATWKIALVSAATAVGATTAVVALTDRAADPASATVPPDEGTTPVDTGKRTVTVTGHGTVEVEPDIAQVSMGVQSTQPEASAVYATLETKSTALVESLKGLGIAEEDIQTSGLNVYPNIDENQISSYVGSVNVSLTLRDLARTGEILDGVQGFVGPELTLGGISFSYAEPENVLAEARAGAIDNARVRAEQFATAADSGVGEVLRIIESSVPNEVFVRETEFAAADASAQIAIEPGSQELAVDVSVVFELT
jgi:uncharacterized protein YggE